MGVSVWTFTTNRFTDRGTLSPLNFILIGSVYSSDRDWGFVNIRYVSSDTDLKVENFTDINTFKRDEGNFYGVKICQRT